MANSYYEEIVGEINSLIEKQEYQQAYKQLQNELEMPYIPKEYENIFIELFKKCNAFLHQPKVNQQAHLTQQEIEKILLNPFDEEIHLAIISDLKSYNIRNMLETIEKYLKNSLFRDENKVHLLFALKEQGIDQQFMVKKNNGNFNLNPKLMEKSEDNKLVKAVLKLLDQFVYNDNPGLYQICLYILDNYFYNLYPLTSKEDKARLLTTAIIYKAHQLQFNEVSLETIADLLSVTNKSEIKQLLNDFDKYEVL